jgi:phospholipid/cholesterol/gamma-HCH transport system substrate-binding protein
VSRSLSYVQAVLLGVVVLAGLGLGSVGLFAVGGQYWPWNQTFHVRAGFAKINGVEVGTRVRVQGMDAGEVEVVHVPAQPGGPVVLRLRLKGELRDLVRADASAQIVSVGMVGGKVVEIEPGTAAEVVAENAMIVTRPSAELTDVLAQVGGTLQALGDGKGPVGEAVLGLLEQGKKAVVQGERTMASVERDAEAFKKVPFVGGYVEDPKEVLVRPNCERNRWVFAATDLFEPDRAVLTAQGRHQLDELAPKLAGFKQKGADLVVVSYAEPADPNPDVALTLTRQRSEAVCNYLKDQHSIHKLGWFSSRKVTALGLGTRPSPVPEKDNPPAARVEVLVFVPQG